MLSDVGCLGGEMQCDGWWSGRSCSERVLRQMGVVVRLEMGSQVACQCESLAAHFAFVRPVAGWGRGGEGERGTVKKRTKSEKAKVTESGEERWQSRNCRDCPSRISRQKRPTVASGACFRRYSSETNSTNEIQ